MVGSVDADSSLAHLVSDLAVLLGSNADDGCEAAIDDCTGPYGDTDGTPEESVTKLAAPEDDLITPTLRDTAIIRSPEKTLIPTGVESVTIDELWGTWNHYQELRMKVKQHYEDHAEGHADGSCTDTVAATAATHSGEHVAEAQETVTRPEHDRYLCPVYFHTFYQHFPQYMHIVDCTVPPTSPYHLDEAWPNWAPRSGQYARSSQLSAAENLQKFVNSKFQLT